MAVHTVRRVSKSEFLEYQKKGNIDHPVVRNNGYIFANVTLVPAYSHARQEYITGLKTEELPYFENALYLKPGELNPKSQYWATFPVFFSEGEIKLNDDLPLDQIKLKVLSQMGIVAKSIADLNQMSSADFVIMNDEQEAENSLKSKDIKDDAVIASRQLSEEQLRDLLTVIQPYERVSTLSFNVIKEKIFSFRDRSPATFLNILNDKKYKKKLFLNKLVNNGMVIMQGAAYKDKMSGELIGHDVESSIDFLYSVKNKQILDAYRLRLNEVTKKQEDYID